MKVYATVLLLKHKKISIMTTIMSIPDLSRNAVMTSDPDSKWHVVLHSNYMYDGEREQDVDIEIQVDLENVKFNCIKPVDNEDTVFETDVTDTNHDKYAWMCAVRHILSKNRTVISCTGEWNGRSQFQSSETIVSVNETVWNAIPYILTIV